jgi:hypothetical protein
VVSEMGLDMLGSWASPNQTECPAKSQTIQGRGTCRQAVEAESSLSLASDFFAFPAPHLRDAVARRRAASSRMQVLLLNTTFYFKPRIRTLLAVEPCGSLALSLLSFLHCQRLTPHSAYCNALHLLLLAD